MDVPLNEGEKGLMPNNWKVSFILNEVYKMCQNWIKDSVW